MMQNMILADFYERDLNKLIDELNMFKDETNLWKVAGGVKNPAGNLALHIIGGTNHHIGATLAKSGYVRNRDREFVEKNVPRTEIVSDLKALMILISNTLQPLSQDQLDKEFPAFFDKPGVSVGYVLPQLLLHINYHLGQINYLRRILEAENGQAYLI